MSGKSQRFAPSMVTEKLVPILLGLIFLGLLVVLVIVGLAVAGVMPGA